MEVKPTEFEEFGQHEDERWYSQKRRRYEDDRRRFEDWEREDRRNPRSWRPETEDDYEYDGEESYDTFAMGKGEGKGKGNGKAKEKGQHARGRPARERRKAGRVGNRPRTHEIWEQWWCKSQAWMLAARLPPLGGLRPGLHQQNHKRTYDCELRLEKQHKNKSLDEESSSSDNTAGAKAKAQEVEEPEEYNLQPLHHRALHQPPQTCRQRTKRKKLLRAQRTGRQRTKRKTLLRAQRIGRKR